MLVDVTANEQAVAGARLYIYISFYLVLGTYLRKLPKSMLQIGREGYLPIPVNGHRVAIPADVVEAISEARAGEARSRSPTRRRRPTRTVSQAECWPRAAQRLVEPWLLFADRRPRDLMHPVFPLAPDAKGRDGQSGGPTWKHMHCGCHRAWQFFDSL